MRDIEERRRSSQEWRLLQENSRVPVKPDIRAVRLVDVGLYFPPFGDVFRNDHVGVLFTSLDGRKDLLIRKML